MPRLALPTWLRRSLEAATVAALVAIASLLGAEMATAAGPYPLPSGPAAALVLAPAVLALGVVTVSYPIAMAATREDALFGAAAAFLLAADLAVVLAGRQILLDSPQLEIGGGLLVAGLAIGPALAGVVGAQVATPLGFGRRAGAICALVAGIAAAAILVAVAFTA
jgi:hypothetical protein